MACRTVVSFARCALFAVALSCSRFKPDDPDTPAALVSDGGGSAEGADAADGGSKDVDPVENVDDLPTIWHPLGGTALRHEGRASFALLASSSHHLEVFLARPDGAVMAAHLANTAPPESAEFETILPPGSVPLDHQLSTVSTVEGGASLFWVKEGRIMSSYIEPRPTAAG